MSLVNDNDVLSVPMRNFLDTTMTLDASLSCSRLAYSSSILISTLRRLGMYSCRLPILSAKGVHRRGVAGRHSTPWRSSMSSSSPMHDTMRFCVLPGGATARGTRPATVSNLGKSRHNNAKSN